MRNRQDTMVKFGFIAFSVSVMMTMIIVSLLFTPNASFADEDDIQEYGDRILEYHALNPTVFGPSIAPVTRQAGGYSMLFTNSRIDLYPTKKNPNDFDVARLGEDCFDKFKKIERDPSAPIAPDFKDFYTTQSDVENMSTVKGSSWLFGQPLTGILDVKNLPVKHAGNKVQWFERAVLVLSGTEVLVMPLGEWFRDGTCYDSQRSDTTSTKTPQGTATTSPTPFQPFQPTPKIANTPTGIHPGATDTPLPDDPFTPWTPTSRTGDEDDAVGIITPTLTTPIPTSTAPALSFTGGAEDAEVFDLYNTYYLEMYGYSAPAPAVAAPVDTSLWIHSDDDDGDSSSRSDVGGAQQPAPSAPDAGSTHPAPANPPKHPQDPPKQPQDPPKETTP